MKNITIGKLRGLQQISTDSGKFIMCAMDHRQGLVSMLEDAWHSKPGYRDIVQVKLDMCSILGAHASGVLLDPEYGVGQCIAQNALQGNTGLLVSIESTGYEKNPKGRLTVLLDDWSVEKIRRLGASAVKILVYYRPDIRDLAIKQLDIIKYVADECVKYDIPFLVEPKTYRVEGEIDDYEFSRRLPEMVIETARQITALPVDVLKAEFPCDVHYETDPVKQAAYCRQLDEASRIPWVILSAGVDYSLFKQQVLIASQAGASGFLGGRAIWQEAVRFRERKDWLAFLKNDAALRMQELAAIAEANASPWYNKLGLNENQLSVVGENWYKEY